MQRNRGPPGDGVTIAEVERYVGRGCWTNWPRKRGSYYQKVLARRVASPATRPAAAPPVCPRSHALIGPAAASTHVPGVPPRPGAGEEIIIFCSRPPLVLAFDDGCRGHSGAHRLPTWMRLALRPRDRSESLRCLAGHAATPRGRLTWVHRVDTMWHGRHVINANSGSSGTTQHASGARHRPGRNGDGRTDRTLPQPHRPGPHPGPGRTAGQRRVVSRQVNAGRTATGQRRRRVPAKPPPTYVQRAASPPNAPRTLQATSWDRHRAGCAGEHRSAQSRRAS